jgi:cyclophilin family peptidyl-prolyl cis-trans isomerase
MTHDPSRRPVRHDRFRFAGRVLVGASISVALAACSGFGVPGGASPLPTVDRSGCPTSQPAALASGQTRTVEIKTSKGSITLKIEGSLAPVAAANFVALAACGFYNGIVFHRVVPGFVIQGGDPKGTGGGGPGYTIDDDPVTTAYHRGTVAMARTSAPHSQGSQFFIVLADEAATSLASANTYAILGEVTAGMDTVDAIAAAADAEIPSHPIAMDAVSVANP